MLHPVQAFESERFAAPSGVPLRTFIVEDNMHILESLIGLLEETTAVRVVGTAPDEQSALDRLQADTTAIDLVIVDIFLKGGSGLGVLAGMAKRKQPAHRVVLTNYASADITRQCLALGASRVFDKSRDLDALVAHCEQLPGISAGSA